MASCTGLACSDPCSCTVPGVVFGSCSLALSLAWLRGLCTRLWVGGSLDTTTLRLVGEKRKKRVCQYRYNVGHPSCLQGEGAVPSWNPLQPQLPSMRLWHSFLEPMGSQRTSKRGWIRFVSSESSCVTRQEVERSENTFGPRSWF